MECADCGSRDFADDVGCMSCLECGLVTSQPVFEKKPCTARLDPATGEFEATGEDHYALWEFLVARRARVARVGGAMAEGPRYESRYVEPDWLVALEDHAARALEVVAEDVAGMHVPEHIWPDARTLVRAHYRRQASQKWETESLDCARLRQRGAGPFDGAADCDDGRDRRYRHSLAVPVACAVALALLMPGVHAAERAGRVRHVCVREALTIGKTRLAWSSLRRATASLPPPLRADVLAFAARCEKAEQHEGTLNGARFFADECSIAPLVRVDVPEVAGVGDALRAKAYAHFFPAFARQ
jgi:hypothetical protein